MLQQRALGVHNMACFTGCALAEKSVVLVSPGHLAESSDTDAVALHQRAFVGARVMRLDSRLTLAEEPAVLLAVAVLFSLAIAITLQQRALVGHIGTLLLVGCALARDVSCPGGLAVARAILLQRRNLLRNILCDTRIWLTRGVSLITRADYPTVLFSRGRLAVAGAITLQQGTWLLVRFTQETCPGGLRGRRAV